MTAEKWEVDIDEWCLDDLEVLERGLGPESSATGIKETLGRLVTNRTAEEIGKIPLKDLKKAVKELRRTIQEMSVPKEKATPS